MAFHAVWHLQRHGARYELHVRTGSGTSRCQCVAHFPRAVVAEIADGIDGFPRRARGNDDALPFQKSGFVTRIERHDDAVWFQQPAGADISAGLLPGIGSNELYAA